MSDTKTALVSINIPAYNAASFIVQTLESLSRQSYTNLEILVCDDGSTDQTAALVTKYQRQDARVRLIGSQKHQGVVAARNRLAQASRGNYIALQDADDYSHPQRINNQVAFLQKNPDYGYVGTFGYLVDEAGKMSLDIIHKPQTPSLIRALSPFDNCFINGSLMYQHKLYAKIGGYQDPLGVANVMEDLLFNYHLSRLSRGANLPKPLYYRRVNLTSINHRHKQSYADDLIKMREHIAHLSQKRDEVLQPVVSVIIPNYNYEEYLHQAVSSVSEQTYRELDIIVVDDCSSDKSVALINKLARKDERIRLITHQHNQGLSAARNTGMRYGYGQYLAFLDSDDYWHPEKIRLQMQVAYRSKAEVVYSGANIVDKQGKLLKSIQPKLKGNIFSELIRGNNVIGSGSTVLIKRELAQLGSFRTWLRSAEDWDYWLRLAIVGTFDFVDRPLVYIRQHEASMQKTKWRLWFYSSLVSVFIGYYIIKAKQPLTSRLFQNLTHRYMQQLKVLVNLIVTSAKEKISI